MSRIRSVHPGMTTDESYMALSHAAARIWPSLWCECDDHGVFEWKPLTLKARLLPAHADDMGALLAELERNDLVKRFNVSGRSYGAVRNFCKFQRPKKPKYTHLLPPELETYVGISVDGSEPRPPSEDESSPPLPHHSGNSSADGGGRMEDEGEKKDEATPDGGRPKPGLAGLAYRMTSSCRTNGAETLRRLRGSNPVVGSSRKSTFGGTTRAAAMSTRRRMPPE